MEKDRDDGHVSSGLRHVQRTLSCNCRLVTISNVEEKLRMMDMFAQDSDMFSEHYHASLDLVHMH